MELKPGMRLQSTVCRSEVIVVRTPTTDVDLRCGGAAMAPIDGGIEPYGPVAASHARGTAIGKRYADSGSGLEVLCTRAGEGSLSLADEPIPAKAAKSLPSSD